MTRETRDGIVTLLERLTREELSGYHDRPIPYPLDQTVSGLVQALADITLGEREQILDSWFDPVQLSALSAFCVRMCSLAVRERSSDLVMTGLLAETFEGFRQDFRDGGIQALAVAHHAARRVGADPGELFAQAASLASPEMAGHIRDFLEREDLDAVLGAVGYREGSDSSGFRYEWGPAGED